MKKIILYAILIISPGFCYSQKINTSLTYSVNLPSVKSSTTPVLVLMHGYGSNENDLLDVAKAFDDRFITFSVRAPFKTKNGGFSWYDVEFLANNEMKYPYSQVIESRKQLLAFIRNACKAYQVDSTQVYVLGFSQGAIMAYELAISSPTKVRGMISLSGRMLDETKTIATDWKQVSKVKILIAHGQSDNVIKFTDSEKAFVFFLNKKVTDLTFKNYEIPHAISGDELNDIKAWLARALDPSKKK